MVRRMLTEEKKKMGHQPNSPDLISCNFLLFRKLEKKMPSLAYSSTFTTLHKGILKN